jgi:hypothetical protein
MIKKSTKQSSEKRSGTGMKKSKIDSTEKKLSTLLNGRLKIMRVCNSACSSASSKISILCDQMLDSIIVAGITGVSAYIYAGQDASMKAAVLSFALTFLIKLKEYRKIT